MASTPGQREGTDPLLRGGVSVPSRVGCQRDTNGTERGTGSRSDGTGRGRNTGHATRGPESGSGDTSGTASMRYRKLRGRSWRPAPLRAVARPGDRVPLHGGFQPAGQGVSNAVRLRRRVGLVAVLVNAGDELADGERVRSESGIDPVRQGRRVALFPHVARDVVEP